MYLHELSRRSGQPISTIKFYLREGLIPPGAREPGTRANYTEAHVERLATIRSMRRSGSSLTRVRELLEPTDDGDGLRAASSVVRRPYALEIIAELGRGSRRFSEIRRAFAHVALSGLETTLRDLIRDGLVEPVRGPLTAARAECRLSAHGADLLPIVAALARWGHEHEATARRMPISV